MSFAHTHLSVQKKMLFPRGLLTRLILLLLRRRWSQRRSTTWAAKATFAEVEALKDSTVSVEDASSAGLRAWRSMRFTPKRVAKNDELHASVIGFLIRYFQDEWENFITRAAVSPHPACKSEILAWLDWRVIPTTANHARPSTHPEFGSLPPPTPRLA